MGSKMFFLGQRLKRAKVICKRLNKEGFGNIQQKAKEALEALKAIQLHLAFGRFIPPGICSSEEMAVSGISARAFLL